MTLGIDGIEGKGRLTGAGKTCNDDELIARDIDVDIFEVIDPRPVNGNIILAKVYSFMIRKYFIL